MKITQFWKAALMAELSKIVSFAFNIFLVVKSDWP